MTDADGKGFKRLSDVILEAMKMALDQKDVAIAEMLARALEMAMTRNAGGSDFIERRSMSEEIEKAILQLSELRKAAQSG